MLQLLQTTSGRSSKGKIDAYLEGLDLVIHYDDDVSPWKTKVIQKSLMASCKLIIEDEVNIKLEGLDVDVRRKLS